MIVGKQSKNRIDNNSWLEISTPPLADADATKNPLPGMARKIHRWMDGKLYYLSTVVLSNKQAIVLPKSRALIILLLIYMYKQMSSKSYIKYPVLILA